MSMRSPVKPAVDKQFFKHTADKTKKINIKPKIMRGGTRF